MLKFEGPDPWHEITKAAGTAGPRFAAIAYIGKTAPNLLPLEKDDILVVNAGDSIVRGHITSPEALAVFVKRKVRVYSVAGLHAKVLATRSHAVVGSANASENSQHVPEAAIITDDHDTIAQVKAFVNDLVAEATEVDVAFIRLARATWAEGKPVHIPGLTAMEKAGIVPTGRVFISQSEDDLESQSHAGHRKKLKQVKPLGGPKSQFSIEEFHDPSVTGWKPGDLVYFSSTVDGTDMLWPPAMVLAGDFPAGTDQGGYWQFLQRTNTDEAMPVDEAESQLKRLGVNRAGLGEHRRITSKAMIAALAKLPWP